MRVIVGAAVLIAAALAPVTVGGAEARGGPAVTIQRIGHPTWKPVDVTVFSATIGTASTGYAEYGTTTASVLPGPDHAPHPDLGVGPGAPHQPPYRREVSQGVQRAGYDSGTCFTPAEFSNGEAVIAAWMVVPHGRRQTGSSPDFLSGPIIPNARFPIHVEGVTFRNGEVFDAALVDFDVPALDAINPAFDVDGHSHFPFFIADNADFGPAGIDLPGEYTYEMTMLDVNDDGWTIAIRFVIRARC